MTPEEMAPHFASFGRNVRIGANVRFVHPEKIHIGDDVLIDDMSHVDATFGCEIRLGNGCRIARGSQIICAGHGFPDGFIRMGDRSCTGFFNVLTGHAGLTIGKDVLIAAHCVLNGYKHGYERLDMPMREQPDSARPITIEDDVYIATGAMVMGVHVSSGVIVAAHAVVTRDVPPLSIVAGVPARIVGNREKGAKIDSRLIEDFAA